MVLNMPYNNRVFMTAPSLASIDIAGIGHGMFLDNLTVFDNQSAPAIGLSNVAGDLCDIVGYGSTYDLESSFGPAFTNNVQAVHQFNGVPLDIGTLNFNSMANLTFQAFLFPNPPHSPSSALELSAYLLLRGGNEKPLKAAGLPFIIPRM